MNTVDDLCLDETDRAVALRQNNKQIKKKKKKTFQLVTSVRGRLKQ